jgi:hypothetical protein
LTCGNVISEAEVMTSDRTTEEGDMTALVMRVSAETGIPAAEVYDALVSDTDLWAQCLRTQEEINALYSQPDSHPFSIFT